MTKPSLLFLAVLTLLSPPLSADPAPAASVEGAPAVLEPSERLKRQLEERRDRIFERLRARGAASAGAPHPSSVSPTSSVGAAPSAGALNSAKAQSELNGRWRRWLETRLERRDRHRTELVKNIGTRLADLRVREELRLHATRVAELGRIEFLAEHARSGTERDKLLARVAKLSAREQKRHNTRLTALLATAPSPSGAPVPKATPDAVGAPVPKATPGSVGASPEAKP